MKGQVDWHTDWHAGFGYTVVGIGRLAGMIVFRLMRMTLGKK